jgi:hypothetical protein
MVILREIQEKPDSKTALARSPEGGDLQSLMKFSFCQVTGDFGKEDLSKNS